ncbi:hypothetical protein ACWGKW_41015 [Streptomyces sp. NPDC054766]|uniref:hypothetical protein n=1 Tax=Streptomyces rhizosphaerihabitans TaxID=1266770 RepID=UPI0021BFD6FD|nr:hypothetical protein [Streptomyces rhizosphaerihabitans]MCT9010571.1 hypothetical protein [Streptomyces rhizosphaerihabitans]
MEATPPLRSHGDGTTVGLFWVSADGVYVGAPATAPAPCVVLKTSGPRVTGPHERDWAWSDIEGLEVTEVPVRSTLQRWATHAATFAAAALDAWVPSSPTEMTVSIAAPDGTVLTPVHSSAAVAYSGREVDLSRQLISRFTRGTATPTVMTEWWEQTRPARVLRSREREALLELWLASA